VVRIEGGTVTGQGPADEMLGDQTEPAIAAAEDAS
jgi:hypothetical protein